MSELRSCPFCGKEMSEKNFFSCDGYPKACGCWETTHTGDEAVSVWNTRPIEDMLEMDKAHAEGKLSDLKDSLKKAVEEMRKETDRLLSRARNTENDLEITDYFAQRVGIAKATDILCEHGLVEEK